MSSPMPHDSGRDQAGDIEGSCYCGRTTYTIHNPKECFLDSAFCHCSRCQRLNGAPCLWTTHWKAAGVNWHAETKRYEVVEGRKYRLRCENCGVTVGTWNEFKQQWSLWPVHFKLRDEETNEMKLEGMDWLKPTAHIFYGTHIIDPKDNLPRFEGFQGKSKQLE